MKSKHLLLTLLLALLVPWAANAQTTVEIGDGTSTDYYTPIGTYYNYSITEQLYTAEEIGMAGTISSISFNYASSTAKDFPITVYMMQTDAENLSTGISLADADVVFEGTYSVTGTGWMTIDLDTPFAYDGTSNLLIGINKGYVYYYSGNTWYHTTTNAVMARYTQQDGSAYTTSTIPGSTRTARPNIRMQITPGSGPSCAKPSGLAVETNALSAVLTWNSEATSFDIAHSMDATADPNNCIVGSASTNSYQFANLDLGDHYVWVRANCGSNGYSDWSSKKSFHIGYCVPAPSSVDNNGISNVTFGMGDYVVNNDTPKATYADYSNLVGAVQEGVESTIAITFKTGYTYNTYVWVDLDNSLSFDADEVVCYGESTSSNPTTLTLSFVIPTTQALGDFRLRIGSADSGLGSDPTAADPCYIDSYGCFQDYTLRVLEAPSCLTPTGLAASNVTGHAATISWTSDADAWQIQLGENAAIDVTETTYTFTGLAPETTFSVKVRTDCGGTYSEWSNPISFTTAVACPAPTVAVNNITSSTADVSCTNTDASEFNLQLINPNVTPADTTTFANVTMPYTLTGLTQDKSYKVRVQAICGGDDGESVWSSGVTFSTAEECPNGVICIGTGKSTNSYLPTYTFYNYSFTQQIYTAEEIGGAGAIMSIDFYMTTSQCTRNLDIYMVMTEQANFASNTDYIAVTESDLVYSGDVTFLQNDWTTIQLNKPFAYADDTQNVALLVVDQTGGYTSSASAFRAFTATGGALRVYNDYNTYDPTNPGTFTNPTNSTTTYTFTKLDVKNRVRLTMGEIVDCDMPTNLAVSDITMETANLTWTAGGSETAWQVCINGDEENLIDVTNNAYQMTGLTAATTYTVKVRANCGESQSYWTPEISFNTALCNAADQCEIYYDFSASTSTTWHSASIDVVDVETNLVLATLTYDQAAPTGSVTVCDGREINFVYNPASPVTYNQYNYFTFTDVNEEVIFSGVGNSSMTTATVLYTHTVSCLATSCRRPTNLAISEIDKHSAKLSWTENGEASEWVIAYTTDSVTFTEMSATETVATITGLAAGTHYSVKVRPVCDLDYWWSNAVTFTTEEACPMDINNVTVNYITNNEATVVWEGTHDNYQVQYRTAENSQIVVSEGSYYDDFENGIANWTIYQEGEGNPWSITNPSSWSGSNAAHSGSYVAVARSWSNNAFNADNWLVSPQVTIPASMSYWMMGDSSYPETYDICVSTTGNAVANFTSVVTYTENPDEWTLVTVDLSAYEGQTGYIAFHQYDYDKDFLWIDDVNIGGETVVTPAGRWMTVETANLAAAITGLTAATTYEYQVRGYCAEEETWSSWTAMATFTTLDVCATPENLVIVPSANSAVLTWEGVQEQYKVLWLKYDEYQAGNQENLQQQIVTGTYFEMTGLESGVQYLVNVIGICSETQQSGYIDGTFTTALLWTDPATWGEPEYPGESNPEPVTIPDDMTVVIPAGTETNPTVIEVTTIEMGSNSQIIIEENAELVYAVTDPTDPNAASQGIDVTMSMTITPSNAKSGADYKLIASPIYETIGVEDCGLTANFYGMDLYSFDASYPHAEWRNYKTNNNFTDLEIGKGYLYYNSESVLMSFSGQTVPSNVVYPIDLAWCDNAFIPEWNGLNLIGNPFTCKATPDRPFYVLNAAGDEIVTTASTEAYVAPMKGFFVLANDDQDLVCQMEKYTEPTQAALNMTLNQNQNLVDRAVVKFGKGENLRKVQLNSNHTKLYMPLDSYDYATMYTDSNVGEMPVNFKAEYNGSYTLSFANDNVEFSYLHLIDNMTGADVDLLANPSYSFNAQTTDYASRFRLVFATGSSVDGDSFGFINSMGNLSIFGIEGTATIQVMDVTGRILSSETFSGSYEKNLNVVPGVYMLRLINGNDVKVQKMVIR